MLALTPTCSGGGGTPLPQSTSVSADPAVARECNNFDLPAQGRGICLPIKRFTPHPPLSISVLAVGAGGGRVGALKLEPERNYAKLVEDLFGLVEKGACDKTNTSFLT